MGAVGQHRDHVAARGKRLGHLKRRSHVQGAGAADKNALGVDQAEQHGDGRLVRHLDGVVDQVVVGAQVGGHTALADSFGERRAAADDVLAARLEVRVQNRAWRVRQDALDVAAHALQVAGHAGKRSACSRGTCPRVDLAVELRPDLGPRGLDVCLAVSKVVKLVGPHGVFQRIGVPLGLVVVVGRVVVRHGRHRVHLGAQEPERVHLALRLRVGHVDHALVPSQTTDMGQADSGVSGGAFDHSAARLDEAAAFGVVQDELGRPVLDQPARVHVLGLDPDVSADFGGKRRELEKRRVAYGGRKRRGDERHERRHKVGRRGDAEKPSGGKRDFRHWRVKRAENGEKWWCTLVMYAHSYNILHNGFMILGIYRSHWDVPLWHVLNWPHQLDSLHEIQIDHLFIISIIKSFGYLRIII